MATVEYAPYTPTPHLLALVDALGFSRVVGRKKSNVLDKYFEAIERANRALHELDASKNIITIGDSAIFTIECPGAENENGIVTPEDTEIFFDRLYMLSLAVALFQGHLAEQNIWTRGAITYDFLQYSASRITGPAFHRAYFLEMEVAKFSRVILDSILMQSAGVTTSRELVAKVNAKKETTPPVLYDHGKMKIITSANLEHDVPTFIDFCKVHCSRQPDGGILSFNDLANKVVMRLRDDILHFGKYRWLANYMINFADHHFTVNVRQQIEHSIRLLQEA